jgi:phenylacetate-coenzyme A ligase PaaK-like adenylate-forming protein
MDRYGRLLRDVLFPAWEGLRRRPTVDLMTYLGGTQWLEPDDLAALQTGLLRRLVRHAHAHTGYYRAVLHGAGLAPEDLRSPADLAALPLLERDAARDTVEARMADGPPAPVVKKATSGTMGKPMVLAYNAESRFWREAIKWRGYGWAGFQPGARSLHFWGVGATPPATRFGRAKIRADRAVKRERYIDCTPRGDDHLATVVAAIRELRPEVILTYAQAGAALARYVVRNGARDWGTIPVITGAERLWPHDREAMEAAFGPALFETYGCREFMLMASECPAHDGLHCSMENLIVEVVVREPGGGVRAAAPGEVGEVVVTDLHNLANPFIRYVNGDLATAREPGQCGCGRWLTRIGPIEGRIAETLRDGRGQPVSGLIFNILFVDLAPHARQFQVIQHLGGDVTLKIVPMDGAALPARVRELVDGFIGKYMPGVAVAIEAVDDIPPTRAGKRQVVVVERAPV